MVPLDDEALFHAVPSAVIVATAQGVIVHASAYAHQMLGYEPGELVGRVLEILMPKEYRAGHRAVMECVRAMI